jgi:chromosome segregation ATPase
MRFAALLLRSLVLPVAALKTRDDNALALESDETADPIEKPVMKVVKMLQDMSTQLNTDLQDDKEVHEKMNCWCETNERDKKNAIEEGGIKIQSLKSALQEAAGQIGEMKVRRKETYDDLQSAKKSLADAKEMRLKEQKAFGKDQADTAAALSACRSAVQLLKQHNPAFLEVRAAAAGLVKTGVLQLGTMNNLKRAALKDFIHDAQTANSFLQMPGFQSYGSQSGQIFGILSQMEEDFEDHLKEIQDQEQKAEGDFQALKSAKEGQITESERQLIDLDTRLGRTGERAAQDEKALQGTEKQLESDTEFLRNLQDKCSESDKEFEHRVKDRMAEIEAVENAIRVLNDEDSSELFDKTVSFLQISSAASEKEQARRESAASTLERAARETSSPVLALLAGRVRNDAFKEVKEAIEGMIAEMEQQQKDETEHRDWCVDEMHENSKDTQKAEDKIETFTASRNDLKSEIKALSMEIESTKATIGDIKTQMKKASETREAANRDYQQTVTDQRMTQMVLQKALTSMRSVYAAMLQDGEQQASTEQPEDFKEYKKNAGGSKVVELLEGIVADSKKAEADAIAAEQNAQATYESFMTDSNKAIAEKSEYISNLSGDRAKAAEEHNMVKRDLAATGKKLADLAAEKDDLHGNCDFIMENFEKRQDARRSEIDALHEADAIFKAI